MLMSDWIASNVNFAQCIYIVIVLLVILYLVATLCKCVYSLNPRVITLLILNLYIAFSSNYIFSKEALEFIDIISLIPRPRQAFVAALQASLVETWE